jgi:hypothetical protein
VPFNFINHPATLARTQETEPHNAGIWAANNLELVLECFFARPVLVWNVGVAEQPDQAGRALWCLGVMLTSPYE